jgi:SecD/SecF fusion protein
MAIISGPRAAAAAVTIAALLSVGGCPDLGVDRTRGVVLTYQVDRESLGTGGQTEAAADPRLWPPLVQALQRRLGTKGKVRPAGDWTVEVTVYERDPVKLDRIKRLISGAGVLEFRLVADPHTDERIMAAAKAQANDANKRLSRIVLDGDQNRVGFWARVGREPPRGDLRPLRVSVFAHVIRNAATGQLVELPATLASGEQHAVERFLAEQGVDDIELLMAIDDGFDVNGSHLATVTRELDETGQPCLNFALGGEGAKKMEGLTTLALPDQRRGFYRLLGIMLDGELLSAPRVMSTIRDRGRITGRFTQEEVDFLVGVLRAGTLPVALQKTPVSEKPFGPP